MNNYNFKKQPNNSILCGMFKTERVKYPSLDDIKKILATSDTGAEFLGYSLFYCFLYQIDGSIVCVNPHRNKDGVREIESSLSSLELSKMLNQCKVGNNTYPWAWEIRK